MEKISMVTMMVVLLMLGCGGLVDLYCRAVLC
jgi:hypothetical protein